jgi:tetratricopeptide (TPR) repeat protein
MKPPVAYYSNMPVARKQTMNITVLAHSAALKDIAVELYNRGRYDDSARHCQNALSDRGTLSFVAVVEWSMLLSMNLRKQGQDAEALSVQLKVSPLVESLGDGVKDEVFLKGKFHNGLAITFRRLGQPDRAFQEYTAASVYHELAGEWKSRAEVENNIAYLLIEMGHPDEAHEHLEKAMRGADDSVTIGQIEDMKARALFASYDTRAALTLAATSVLRLLGTDNETALDNSVATLAMITTHWPLMREAERIKKALTESGGHIESAAKLLGYKNRQTLENKIKRHFPFLEDFRTPKRQRRKRAERA